MLLRFDLARVERVALGERGKGAVLADRVVDPFLVNLEEAVEADHRACGPDTVRLAVLAGDVDLGGRALDLGARGLARQRPLPDQLVKLGGVRIEIAADGIRLLGEIGRPDGLMRFLRVLGLGLVFARGGGHVAVAVELGDQAADGGDRFRHDLHAVGSHIGDESLALAAHIDALVKPLRKLHGMARRKAELARRLLLEGRGGEGGGGVAALRLALDARDHEASAFERRLQTLGSRLHRRCRTFRASCPRLRPAWPGRSRSWSWQARPGSTSIPEP